MVAEPRAGRQNTTPSKQIGCQSLIARNRFGVFFVIFNNGDETRTKHYASSSLRLYAGRML